ncbi:MAG TPA: glycosyltransferase [Chthoniobacteraceae bacterium]|nr:glycosyltransferase [Chthoniobacteraceae bacterium]
MRSKNDDGLIGATLRGVKSQEYAGPVEMVHIDSGSTDHTVPIIKSFDPDKLIHIRAGDYIPGAVLNRGMRETHSQWVVFLNSDCEPVGRRWLRDLIAAVRASARNGAAYGAQRPRPGCQAVYAHDYERCFGPNRESTAWDHFFSMANSVVNREAWEAEPFREDLQYSEDDEWSRRLIARGWKIPYAPGAGAIHSHNYTLRQAFKRCHGEAFALAALDCVDADALGFSRTVLAGAAKESLRDLRYCLRTGSAREWPHAVTVRVAQRLGKWKGFKKGWAHYRSATLEPAHV